MCRIVEHTKVFFRSETKLVRSIPFFGLNTLKLKHQAMRSTLCRIVEHTKVFFRSETKLV